MQPTAATGLYNPHLLAGCTLVVLVFGIAAIIDLPLQLMPNVTRPQLFVSTQWRAAAPFEIEAEILEPQERALRGIPGLYELQTGAEPGLGWATLTFAAGTDRQRALIDVVGRLNQLDALPIDADPPRVDVGPTRGARQDVALSWFYLHRQTGNTTPIEAYLDVLEDVIRPRIEAIHGVAGIAVGRVEPVQLQIVVDVFKAAALQIPLTDVVKRINQAADISAGYVDVGRREYSVRYVGEYLPEDLAQIVIATRNGKIVRLGDFAKIHSARGDRRGFVIQNGEPALSFRVDKLPDANVLTVLAAVKAELDLIRREITEPRQLAIQQSFDASAFIYRAIAFVSGNLVLGGLLTIAIVWLFLRSIPTTLAIAATIPLALLATLITLNLLGRTLNVISLAGLALASGLVVDAAVVVVDNVNRIFHEGSPAREAAERGVRQVGHAIGASTVTTIAVFVPVIFIDDIEGQIFSDLALTIAIASFFALLAALVILPGSAALILSRARAPSTETTSWANLSRKIAVLTATTRRQWFWIAGLIVCPVALTIALSPPLDFLPPVKRDSIDGFFNLPAGANVDFVETEIAATWVERLRPHLAGNATPALSNYYLIVFGPSGGTIGARPVHTEEAGQVHKLLRDITAGVPDLSIAVVQGSLFGNNIGARQVQLRLQASDYPALMDAAPKIREQLLNLLPGSQIQMFPTANVDQPELRLFPNDRALNDAGWTRAELGNIMRVFGDGMLVGEYFDGDEQKDVILRTKRWASPPDLAGMPVIAPNGRAYRLDDLVDLRRTVSPGLVSRVNGRRTVNLTIALPDDATTQQFVDTIRSARPLLQSILPADATLLFAGSARSLISAIQALGFNLLAGFFLLFLIMAAIFKSFWDSAIVLLALPLASCGGIIALRLVNVVQFQPLDILTMIGFVILAGLVVNNAILLVDQTRQGERDGLSTSDAVEQALRIRIRPIFISTATSAAGVLPMILIPGEGSQIYRGLAAAIFGGMTVSMFFTLVFIPAALQAKARWRA